MKLWGLAIVSLGGFLIMTSQVQANQVPLLISGLSLIVGGAIMFVKGKAGDK